MRRRFYLLSLLRCLLLLCSVLAAPVLADQVQLKDGRLLEVEEIWETEDLFWYRQGGLMMSVAKAEVERIIKRPSVSGPGSALRGPTASQPASVTTLRPRILLRDGGEIVADEVQEYDGYLRYRLGTMQTLIEREAIERIVREPVIEAPAPPPADVRFTSGNTRLDKLILSSALKHQLDPLIIYLVMREESGFNHRAVSRVGARGLMQLMPETARRLGVRNIHDPVENVEAGTRLLKSLLMLYEGDGNLTLAAYNAGEGAVARYGRRVPPYRETVNYVRRINAAYRKAKAIREGQ